MLASFFRKVIFGQLLIGLACTNGVLAENTDGVVIQNYSATIQKNWTITAADISDRRSFEIKIAGERMMTVCQIAQKYPDLTHITVRENYVGPGETMTKLYQFSNLEQLRSIDPAMARSAMRTDAEQDLRFGHLLPDSVYLTQAEMDKLKARQETALHERKLAVTRDQQEQQTVKAQFDKILEQKRKERPELVSEDDDPRPEFQGTYMDVKAAYIQDMTARLRTNLRLPKDIKVKAGDVSEGASSYKVVVDLYPDGKIQRVECVGINGGLCKDQLLVAVIEDAVRKTKFQPLPKVMRNAGNYLYINLSEFQY